MGKVKSIYDGPYIFTGNDKIIAKWIENGKLREDTVKPGDFASLKNKFKLSFDFDDLVPKYLEKPNYYQSFRRVDSIGVITDIHGEYDKYINLLKAMKIVDNDLNWIFGSGHLVVLGDIFDRGDKVTETLWHIYGLEKQAAEAGGMIHFLLGNHELMILGDDLRYISEKYRKVEEITGIKYSDLYSGNSVLGRWLRSRPAMITINNIIFAHAGISIDMVLRDLTIMKVNEIFSGSITGNNPPDSQDNETINFLNGANGPFWYRGYFLDMNFSKARLDSILTFYGKRHIVVGHTSFEGIRTLFNNRIIGIDAGISIGSPGAMLLIKKETFYMGSWTGERIKL